MSVLRMIPGWADKTPNASDSELLRLAKEQERQLAAFTPKLERFMAIVQRNPDDVDTPEVQGFAAEIDADALEIFDVPSLDEYGLSLDGLLTACRERQELVGIVKELHAGASVGAALKRQVSGFTLALLSRAKSSTALNAGIDDRALNETIGRYDKIGALEERLGMLSQKFAEGELNSVLARAVHEEIKAQRKLAESALVRESNRLLEEMGDDVALPSSDWMKGSNGRRMYYGFTQRYSEARAQLQGLSERAEVSRNLASEIEGESSPSGRLTCLLRLADFISGLAKPTGDDKPKKPATPTKPALLTEAESVNTSNEKQGIVPSLIIDAEAKIETTQEELRTSALEEFKKAWDRIKETVLASNDHAGEGVLSGLERELTGLRAISTRFPNERDFNEELQARVRTLSAAIERIRDLQASTQRSVAAVDTAIIAGIGSPLADTLSSLQRQIADHERFLASPDHATSSLSDRADGISRAMRELETRMEELRSRAPLALDPSLFVVPPIVLAISQEVGRYWYLPGQRELGYHWDFPKDVVEIPQRVTNVTVFLDDRRLSPFQPDSADDGRRSLTKVDVAPQQMPWPKLEGPISGELLMQIFRKGNLEEQKARALNVRVAGLVAAQEHVQSLLSLPAISLSRGTLQENVRRVEEFEQALQKRDAAMSALWQQLELHEVHPAMALPEIPELRLPKQPIYSNDSSASPADPEVPFDISDMRALRYESTSLLRELGQNNAYMQYGYDTPRKELGQDLQDMAGETFLADLFRRMDTQGVTAEAQENMLRQADFVLAIHVALACRVLDAIALEYLGGQTEGPDAHELRRRCIALAMQNLRFTMDRVRAYREYIMRKLYPEPVAMPRHMAG